MPEAFRRIVYPDGRVHDIKPMIDVVHAYLHTGIVSYWNFTNKSVANGANLDVAITIPANYELHFTFSISLTGLSYLTVGEGATIVGGTPVPAYLMQRDSSIAPVYTVVHSPTVSAAGTAIINERMLPGGTQPTTRVGSATRDQTEWVLNGGRTYLLRVNNASGSNEPIGLEGVAYHKED